MASAMRPDDVLLPTYRDTHEMRMGAKERVWAERVLTTMDSRVTSLNSTTRGPIMSTKPNSDSELAKLDPEARFSRPLDVLNENGMTRNQKISVLEHWQLSLVERLRATGEGMAPPAGQTAAEAARIEEISDMLEALRHEVGIV